MEGDTSRVSDREREADDDRSRPASTPDDDRPPRRSVADHDRSPGESRPGTAGESGSDATGESGNQSAEESEDDRERPPPPPIDREHPSMENVVFFLLGVLVALVTLAQLLGGAI